VTRRGNSAAWDELVAEIDANISATGSWAGEAMRLRDAAGYKRLRVRVWEDIVNRLNEAGFDAESEFGGVPFESLYVTVQARGWADWLAIGEALLDEFERAEKDIPDFGLWRDKRVRSRAIGRWALAQTKDGRLLGRREPLSEVRALSIELSRPGDIVPLT